MRRLKDKEEEAFWKCSYFPTNLCHIHVTENPRKQWSSYSKPYHVSAILRKRWLGGFKNCSWLMLKAVSRLKDAWCGPAITQPCLSDEPTFHMAMMSSIYLFQIRKTHGWKEPVQHFNKCLYFSVKRVIPTFLSRHRSLLLTGMCDSQRNKDFWANNNIASKSKITVTQPLCDIYNKNKRSYLSWILLARETWWFSKF